VGDAGQDEILANLYNDFFEHGFRRDPFLTAFSKRNAPNGDARSE